MENFFVFLIFLLMVLGPLVRFYNRWKSSGGNPYKKGLPRQEYTGREFYSQDQNRDPGQPEASQGDDPQPPDQVIVFEEYVFSLEGSNTPIGESLTTNLSGAQVKGAQYAEKYKQAVNLYKFVAGKRIWIDKIYPPGDSN